MSDTREVALTVNGQPRQATVEARTTLVDLLREGFRLTGTHIGCEHGVCGACTVLVNGDAVRGCLMLAVQADGARVETVESLAPDPEHLNPLQAEFVRHHGVQCGFCTGGILMSLTAALRENPRPTEAEIRDTLAGHALQPGSFVNEACPRRLRRHPTGLPRDRSRTIRVGDSGGLGSWRSHPDTSPI